MRRVSFGIVSVAGCVAVGAAIGVTVLASAGCGRSRPSTFYTLSSLNAAPASPQPETGGRPLVIEIGPIELPQYVDRPQIVTRVSPNRLALAEFNRWAEPLPHGFSRVLVENLSILLGTERITLYARRNPTPPDFQVMLNVTKFDGTPGGKVSLVARWSVVAKDGSEVAPITKSTISVATGAADYEGLAAAMSQAIAELSREIAAAIKSHPTS